MAILITSAVAFREHPAQINDISDLSLQLVPLLGHWSTRFLSLGFLAAGLSSAITAPLAASFATSEILGWDSDLRSRRFRLVWTTVLLVGVLFSSLEFKPVMVILFAQFTNGLLLPVLAVLLLWIMNDKRFLEHQVNGTISNILGALVVVITLLLGWKSIGAVLGFWN